MLFIKKSSFLDVQHFIKQAKKGIFEMLKNRP
jgi:hypothetical protein